MNTHNQTESSGSIDAFLKQARESVENHDFSTAVDTYLKAIEREPDNVALHTELRQFALHYHKQNKSLPDIKRDPLSDLPSDALNQMLEAEHRLTIQPNRLRHARNLLHAAVKGGYSQTVIWIGELILHANNKALNPSLKIYLEVINAYESAGALDRALNACRQAMKWYPKERELIHQKETLSEKMKNPSHHLSSEINTEPEPSGQTDPMEKPVETSENGEDTQLTAAKLFFDKGQKAAEAMNYDYAIEMYIEGLKRAPQAIQEGHLPLCQIALKRQAHGGKKPTMVERAKTLGNKNPLDQMLNAETLFCKDPSHLGYAESMLKAALEANYQDTAHWIADLIFQTNNAASKPSANTYILLKDAYRQLKKYDKALAACRQALKLKPEDKILLDDLKYLSAELTMVRGKYDQEGDFRKAIKDRDRQAMLYAQDRTIKTMDHRQLAVQESRQAYDKNPQSPKAVKELANALSDLETHESEHEAFAILSKAYQETSDFSFKQRQGELKIRQLKRLIREAKNRNDENRRTESVDPKTQDLQHQLIQTELDHYEGCVEHYPTDRRYKYEYAVRLFERKRYDQAIPLFQESQKDPSRRIWSMNYIGQCFLAKSWITDAIDIFKSALQQHARREDRLSKDLRYNLASAYEALNDTDNALEIYRKLAQLDFNFRDVNKKVSQLRLGSSEKS